MDYTRLKSDKRKYDRSYKSSGFLSMISHEFGHVWGLHDAYDKPDKMGWNEAAETKEVSKDNIMRSNKRVQPNDIEMILEAWKYNKSQRYADFYYKLEIIPKSQAVKYKEKGD